MDNMLSANSERAATHHQSRGVNAAGYKMASRAGQNILCKYAKYATNAFAARVLTGSSSTTDPPVRCARNVTTLEIMVRISNGIFSRISCENLDASCNVKRRRGQKSTRSKTKGSVTSIGFAISPNPNKTSTAEYVDSR